MTGCQSTQNSPGSDIAHTAGQEQVHPIVSYRSLANQKDKFSCLQNITSVDKTSQVLNELLNDLKDSDQSKVKAARLRLSSLTFKDINEKINFFGYNFSEKQLTDLYNDESLDDDLRESIYFARNFVYRKSKPGRPSPFRAFETSEEILKRKDIEDPNTFLGIRKSQFHEPHFYAVAKFINEMFPHSTVEQKTKLYYLIIQNQMIPDEIRTDFIKNLTMNAIKVIDVFERLGYKLTREKGKFTYIHPTNGSRLQFLSWYGKDYEFDRTDLEVDSDSIELIRKALLHGTDFTSNHWEN